MKNSLPLFGLNFRSGVALGRVLVLFAVQHIAAGSYCQRSYFEYNNPQAVKINEKKIDKITDVEWNIKDVRWLVRRDTFDYDYDYHGRALTLHRDGTYSSSFARNVGKWNLKYHRYLVLTGTSEHISNGALTGTFSVASIADSTLVLTQLHTSSRDMSRTLTLVKYKRKDLRPMQVARTRPPMPATFSPSILDSLSFLSKYEWSFLDYRENNDTLYIEMPAGTRPDTVYKVHLDRNNPLRKVKIFENEDVADLRAYKKFTVSAQKLQLVDTLAIKYMSKRLEGYYTPKEITFILWSYFRQYVGYFDTNGDAIVLINAFCQYRNSWGESLVQLGPDAVCHFNISVNLTTKQAFSFKMNGY